MRILLYVVLSLAAVVSLLAVRALSDSGAFTTLVPRFDGECQRLEGLVGAEDMAFDREAGVVYAAGWDRRTKGARVEARGGVWAIPMADPSVAEPVDLTGGAPGDFQPRGMDLFIDGEGVRRLFVLNRGGETETLEIFRVESTGGLTLERTLSDPALRHANDVLALGPARAYVTLSSKRKPSGLLHLAEVALGRSSGSVLYLQDGQPAQRVADGLSFANGLALSRDGAQLYVAETVGRSIAIYRRDPATNALQFLSREFVGTGVDNIIVDERGQFWIGAHPKTAALLQHAWSRDNRSPSQVILIDPNAGQGDQVFLSLGEDMSGVSVAVADVEARTMLLGAVYEPFVLACELPEVWRHSEAYPAARPVNRGE